MSNTREADARLEYWRLKYSLADEDLDQYSTGTLPQPTGRRRRRLVRHVR
jgi:hypothetical protein